MTRALRLYEVFRDFFTLAFSIASYATECIEGPITLDVHTTTEQHWDLASDVIFGKVLRGSYSPNDESRFDVSFDFEVLKSFKGGKSGIASLLSPSHESISLGHSYIIFLYGHDHISRCAKIIDLFPGTNDLETLYYHSKRKDLGFAKDVGEILRIYGYKP